MHGPYLNCGNNDSQEGYLILLDLPNLEMNRRLFFQIIGFLNFFLWGTNLWFIYKETAWSVHRSGPPQGGQQLP